VERVVLIALRIVRLSCKGKPLKGANFRYTGEKIGPMGCSAELLSHLFARSARNALGTTRSIAKRCPQDAKPSRLGGRRVTS